MRRLDFVKCASHLFLESAEVAPSAEWTFECTGWCFLRVSQQYGYWMSENGTQEVGAGHVVALLPLRDGCFRASQLGPVTLHYFGFSPALADGLITPVEHDRLEALAHDPSQAIRVFGATTRGAQLWTELVSHPSSGNTLLQRVQLLRIVATLFATELEQPEKENQVFLFTRQKLRLLLNQMSETEFLQLESRDLAARCGVSVTQVGRSFRKLFGMSLKERQELIRLQKARQRLLGTTLPLEHIAADAAYCDVGAFTRAYQKQFGEPPIGCRQLRRRKKPVRQPQSILARE